MLSLWEAQQWLRLASESFLHSRTLPLDLPLKKLRGHGTDWYYPAMTRIFCSHLCRGERESGLAYEGKGQDPMWARDPRGPYSSDRTPRREVPTGSTVLGDSVSPEKE